MAALSLTPWSPLRAWTTWTPLVMVVGVSMLKEAQEDYRRYQQDKEVNERPTRVLDRRTGAFVTVPWRRVHVGDVLQVRRDEYLPADLVMLCSSNLEGTCYVETMNLDGETNLKIKAAPEPTKGLAPAALADLHGCVECEAPNSRLYQFAGNLRLAPPLPPGVAAATAAGKGAEAGAGTGTGGVRVAGKEASVKGGAAGGGGGGGGGIGGWDGAVAKGVVLTDPDLELRAQREQQPQPQRVQSLGCLQVVVGTAAPAAEGLAFVSDIASSASVTSASMTASGGRGAGGAGGKGGAAGEAEGCCGAEGGGAVVVPLSASTVLLRGCSLRNTDCVYGVVVYAGHDTKVFMNSTQPPSKRSHVERLVDRIIGAVFVLLFLWCLTSACFHATWTAKQLPRHWYMRPDVIWTDADPDSPVQTGVVNFFVALLLYSYLVPISLYVSIEVVKVFQAMVLIASDRDMYHAESDTPALARTSNLNEELGMVGAIMTDKTGTLTRNVMEFFKCSVAGVAYGAGVTEVERTNAARRGMLLSDNEDPEAEKYRERYFNFYDDRLMGGAWSSAQDPATVEMFFRLLAVCHTVIPDGPPDPATIKYEAESPDEAALVVAAKVFGFFFHKRTNTTVTVRERTARGEVDVEYEVLNILEFNSTRKRMSVVIKDKATDKIIIFTKGADTVIYERLDPGYGPNEAMRESTDRHMEEFGSAGLRTLCLSYAEVDREWYSSVWLPEWVAAKTSLTERDAKVAEVSEKIERNLRLLGCTAIEDKLQEGVPECIRQLALAGIRIWVLTGDKMETAINIGFACSLLTEEMNQFTISAASPRVQELEKAGRQGEADALAAELVASQLEKIEASLNAPGCSDGFADSNSGSAPTACSAPAAALIIDGKALSFALSKQLAPAFLRVGLRCKAVVCCRVSPLQKAQVTQLVRGSGRITLAVGDGANDVGMIQRAHIGVGISGQEGMQAVMSADFAIAQFRFLVPLLLVHGRYSYKRITRMINFFFYKNLLFAITLFTYSAFTTFSGSYVYNDTSMTLFNVAFTSATPLLVGMFDRPLPKRALLRYPHLYRAGAANHGFNLATLLAWLAASVAQAGVILLLVLVGAAGTAAAGPEGIPHGMAEVGVVLFTAVVLTVHLHLAIIEEAWTWVHHLAIWGSIALWYVYLLAFGRFPVSWSLEIWMLFEGVVAPSRQFWLFSLLVPTAAVLPTAAAQALRRLAWPSDEDIIREMRKAEQAACPEAKLSQRVPSIDPQFGAALGLPPLPVQARQQQQQQKGQGQQPPAAAHHLQDPKLLQSTQELLNTTLSDIQGAQQGSYQVPRRKPGGLSSPRLLLGSQAAGGSLSGGGGGSNRVVPEPLPPAPRGSLGGAGSVGSAGIGGGGGGVGSGGGGGSPRGGSSRGAVSARCSGEVRGSTNQVARTTVTTLALPFASSVPNATIEAIQAQEECEDDAPSYQAGGSTAGSSRLGAHSSRGRALAVTTGTPRGSATSIASGTGRSSASTLMEIREESRMSTPPGAVGWQSDMRSSRASVVVSGGAGGGGAGGNSGELTTLGSRPGVAPLAAHLSIEELTPRRAALLGSRGNNAHANLHTSVSTPALCDTLNALSVHGGRAISLDAAAAAAHAAGGASRTRAPSPMGPTASVSRGQLVMPTPHQFMVMAYDAGPAPPSPCSSDRGGTGGGGGGVGPERSLPSHASHRTGTRSGREASALPSAAASTSTRPVSSSAVSTSAPLAGEESAAADNLATSSVMRLHRGSDGRFTGSGPQLLGGEEAMAQLQASLATCNDGGEAGGEYVGCLETVESSQSAAAAAAALYELPARRSVHGRPLPMEDLG